MEPQPHNEITRALHAARSGDRSAYERFFDLVTAQLRQIAMSQLQHEKAGHTLQPTAVVNEAYLKLAGSLDAARDSGHFFRIAANSMRQILVDHARTRGRKKRAGHKVALPENLELPEPQSQLDLIALDEALGRLRELDSEQAEIVVLKYFGGRSVDEIANVLGRSAPYIRDRWDVARIWLRRQMLSAN